MDQTLLAALLANVADHSIPVAEALEKLKHLPFEDLGFATIDHHRGMRKGYPEAIFCQNKTPDQVVAIAQAQIAHGVTVLGTRATGEVLDAVGVAIPDAEVDATARCFWKKSSGWVKKESSKPIVICSAGTADRPVAAEAQRTAEIIGYTPVMVNDVGVAGIHRLFSHSDTLLNAGVILAIAGMEGALPSVIAGYVSCPVIGVPTSVGYGVHLGGLVPLFAMLNSCATGLAVVNIDNGFGAACAAAGILAVQ
jgi:NCAIR mutase (PurE)-related protein